MNLNISRPQYERLSIYFNFDNYAEYTLICCNSYDTPYDILKALIDYKKNNHSYFIVKDGYEFVKYQISFENGKILITNMYTNTIVYFSETFNIDRSISNMLFSCNKYFADIVNWNRTAPFDSLYTRAKRAIKLYLLIRELKGKQ